MLDRSLLFAQIDSAQRILLAGAGGGYDIFAGLPLYFHLRGAGKTVHLANLSFSSLRGISPRLAPAAVAVTADSPAAAYFPEKYLCEWFRARGEDVSIACFSLEGGVAGLAHAYETVVTRYGIDAVILVDGGTDSLMRGDEKDLGTPEEDIASIAAVDDLPLPLRYLVCVGFGVDAFHGVSHGLFLQNAAALVKAGAFLGVSSLLPQHPEAGLYGDASQYVFERMPQHPSIVSSSILAATAGEFGDHHATHRTEGSQLWINPLMSLYWAFDLAGVARRCLYLDRVKGTTSYAEVSRAIYSYQESLDRLREWVHIPL